MEILYFFSGVLGMFLNLLSIRLEEEEEQTLDFQASLAISKVSNTIGDFSFFYQYVWTQFINLF